MICHILTSKQAGKTEPVHVENKCNSKSVIDYLVIFDSTAYYGPVLLRSVCAKPAAIYA